LEKPVVPRRIRPGKLDGVTVHPWIDRIDVLSGVDGDQTSFTCRKWRRTSSSAPPPTAEAT
jgi:hypothetical protein